MRPVVVLLAVAALAGSGCGEPDTGGRAIPPASPVDTTAPDPAPGTPPLASHDPSYEAGAPLVADLVGIPLPDFDAEVTTRGYGPVRIAWQDGESLDLTDDLVPGRVNVAVSTDGAGTPIVVDAYVETDPETGAAGEATIVDVYDGVGFYPACGNESLTDAGITWHQVNQGEYPELYDRVVSAPREDLPRSVTASGFAPRVVAPGPGDDIGTLVVWSDDVAYFVSDSGDLRAWLVTDELTYDWVC